MKSQLLILAIISCSGAAAVPVVPALSKPKPVVAPAISKPLVARPKVSKAPLRTPLKALPADSDGSEFADYGPFVGGEYDNDYSFLDSLPSDTNWDPYYETDETVNGSPKPKKESISQVYDDEEYVPVLGYKGDAPLYTEIEENDDSHTSFQLTPYLYALDVSKMLKPVTGLPGSLRFADPTFPAEFADEYLNNAYHSTDMSEACNAIRALTQIDGSKYMKSIPKQELHRPVNHYFAVVLDKDAKQGPSFYRLNQGGVWSTKPNDEPMQKVSTHEFKSNKEAMEYLKSFDVASMTAGKFNGHFCGFFKVTSGLKAFIEKEKPFNFVGFRSW